MDFARGCVTCEVADDSVFRMLIQQQQRFQSQLLGLRSVSSPPVRAPVRLLSLTPLLLEMSRLENDEEGSTTLVITLTISQYLLKCGDRSELQASGTPPATSYAGS